jgi:hypothetical protein
MATRRPQPGANVAKLVQVSPMESVFRHTDCAKLPWKGGCQFHKSNHGVVVLRLQYELSGSERALIVPNGSKNVETFLG